MTSPRALENLAEQVRQGFARQLEAGLPALVDKALEGAKDQLFKPAAYPLGQQRSEAVRVLSAGLPTWLQHMRDDLRNFLAGNKVIAYEQAAGRMPMFGDESDAPTTAVTTSGTDSAESTPSAVLAPMPDTLLSSKKSSRSSRLGNPKSSMASSRCTRWVQTRTSEPTAGSSASRSAAWRAA